MCFKLTGPRKYALALVSTENTHLLFHDYLRSIFRRHISWRVLKIAFRSLQIWKFPWEDTPRPPYKSPAFGTRDNAPPPPLPLQKTYLRPWLFGFDPLPFFGVTAKIIKQRLCLLKVPITLICQIFIVFTYEFLSPTERRNLQRRFQANCIGLFWKRVWIRDILIELTERFFSGYARSSSLNFVVMNKSESEEWSSQ